MSSIIYRVEQEIARYKRGDASADQTCNAIRRTIEVNRDKSPVWVYALCAWMIVLATVLMAHYGYFVAFMFGSLAMFLYMWTLYISGYDRT